MFNDTPAWKLHRLLGVRQWYVNERLNKNNGFSHTPPPSRCGFRTNLWGDLTASSIALSPSGPRSRACCPANICRIRDALSGSDINRSRTPGRANSCWIFFVPERWYWMEGDLIARDRSNISLVFQSYKNTHQKWRFWYL